ncbi:uncharacterized protein F4822DRAFT_163102 [Hypoxylon trugodes]|uniref:uncharacterized protein n=1 Tax=Hypoxylon trugodes TaxID=326681 RepID=UPI00219644F0|nr:uncharacterized protein F4822DRAFT_163102 [Hypoxylon trugodes]KAI1390778.1 hypothetical protein F4822DRAFT_163102 [Hypoxylon trugodes]
MARKNTNEDEASLVGDNHARLLYNSLDQYNGEQKRRRRPSVLLAALLVLFLSSAAGITIAVVLMLQPIEVQSACIARDLVLFASSIAMLYICIHIRGSRRNYIRKGPGPPQTYGNYLHASALLFARLGIAVWVAALVATNVMIAKVTTSVGIAKVAPYLDLAVCILAIPSFIAISATIESNSTPFATKGLSRNSFLSSSSSKFSDDLTADLSVSRRASLQRKESTNASIMTVPTAEIFRLGSSGAAARNPQPLVINTDELSYDRTELMANSPIGATHYIPTIIGTIPSSLIPTMPKLPLTFSEPPPKPVYIPGGWRTEWNNTYADQVGPQMITEPSIDNSTTDHTPYYSSSYPASSADTSRSSTPSKISNGSGRTHRVTPSTSIASSSQRSRLSTVRYAAQPEIAIRQAIRVIRNPNYSPPTVIAGGDPNREVAIRPPEPVAMPRNCQQVQDVPPPPSLQRKPSNFSRPLLPSTDSDSDSAVVMNIPETIRQELPRE